MKNWYIYIVASKKNWTIYTWVTNNLVRRIFEHKEGNIEWFSKKYGCKILVYYEVFGSICSAIEREKQIKWWTRKKKITLIENKNLQWKDLYQDIIE